MRRWSIIALLMVLSATIGSCVTYVAQEAHNYRAPKSQLIQAAPTETWRERGHGGFSKLLTDRFPPGTRQSDLIAALKREGFKPGWSYSGDEHVAEVTWSNVACAMTARVFWETDDQARVTKIRGVYPESVCL